MKVALICDTHFGFNSDTEIILSNFFQNLAQEKPDMLLHLGDWISHRQDQFEPILQQIRTYFPEIPILGVRGNHDFWDISRFDLKTGLRDFPTITQLDSKHKRLFKKYNIHHLQNKPYTINNTIIFGFDSWYSVSNPPTNDKYKMQSKHKDIDINQYLFKKAYFEYYKIIKKAQTLQDKNLILATHFATFTENQAYLDMCAEPQWHSPIIENFKYYLVGHSHVKHDRAEKSCRIINPGSDYNTPKYKILTIEGLKT